MYNKKYAIFIESNKNAPTYVDLRKKKNTNLMRNEIMNICAI